ncbi:MAG: MurR/RpiR family transcriptional regulator [Hungatella sp.]|nr:MurR/RpiR family transcriptional regulator [Hungatella sp.]
MNPLELLEKEFPNLTKSEQAVTTYILNNPMSVIRYSLTQIAREARTSNTAIIRLCQKLGYQGFSEFKFSLSRAALSEPYESSGGEEAEDSMTAIVSQYVQYLNQMAAEADRNQIRQIAARICHSSRLAIMGYNRTGFSASQLSYRLSRIGVANYLVTDQVVMMDYMEIFGPGDLCLIFSISASKKYKDIIQRLNKNGASAAMFTMNNTGPQKRLCDYYVCLPQISYNKKMGFLDDQAIFFVFIEVLISEVAKLLNQSKEEEQA